MEFSINVPQGAERVSVLGAADRNLKILREALGVRIAAREGSVVVSGESDAVRVARGVLERLMQAASRAPGGGHRRHFNRQEIIDLIGQGMSGGFRESTDDDADENPSPTWDDEIGTYGSAGGPGGGGRQVRAKSANQQAYLDAIRDHDLVFGIGPAGTGKTYLAVAAAVHMLRLHQVRKVILVRPAVEAGERLGFLPGDLQAKVNPYLRPLFDALNDMMDYATIRRFMTSDVVEVIPLAYMRGRTLNQAVIILDEAQNTTRGQMQMFLTRMGHGSKMIVTGDVTQIDLPDPRESGLIDAARRLARVPGVAFVGMTQADIVRHNLVQRIVEAYADAPFVGTSLPVMSPMDQSTPAAPAYRSEGSEEVFPAPEKGE